MGRKLAEPIKLSSRRCKCLLTAVYAKYFESIDQTLSVTTTTTTTTTMGENNADSDGARNQGELLEVDSTHIEEISQLCHKASTHLQSSRSKEKRKIEVHITSRNVDRYEKNEQGLDRTGKEGLGQSGFENGGVWPVLDWE
ncbi:unnamed protein product [Schistosoma mattheei]|uniref:Uncharacterized protein n=1 Tax=Schistosoma mattheei TaxID=31246 RepID=A0A183P8A6_9TREM|nr:unnamed protein product [Schistosoma mattheei]